MRATIKLKLALTFTVIIALAATMAWFGINSLGALNTSMDSMANGAARRLQTAQDSEANVLRIVRAEKNMLLAEKPEQISAFDAEIGQLRSQLLARLDKWNGFASAEGKQKLVLIWRCRAAVECGARQDPRSRSSWQYGPRHEICRRQCARDGHRREQAPRGDRRSQSEDDASSRRGCGASVRIGRGRCCWPPPLSCC